MSEALRFVGLMAGSRILLRAEVLFPSKPLAFSEPIIL